MARRLLRPPWRRSRVDVTAFGRYELRVERVHERTRSEGRIGRLFLDGREVHGTPGDRIDLPDGRVVTHLGDDRPHLWSVSGWSLASGGHGASTTDAEA